MPKIAVIYSRFGPYHVARLHGASSVFTPKGWEVVGIEVCPDDQFYAWDKVAKGGGVRRVGLFPNRGYEELSRKIIQAGVKCALDAEQPDAVACPGWYFAEALAGAGWCRRNRKLAVLMSESGRQDHRRIWWREWLKRKIIRKYDCALAGGRVHAEYLQELGMPLEHIAFGHNVVDNDHFSNGAAMARQDAIRLRQSMGLPAHYLLASGRFVEKKNFGGLLAAYRAYRATSSTCPFALVVCGDGPLRSNLKAQAEALGIGGDVHWPGFIQYGKLPAFYGLAEAFILPSTSEPWGLVVNEAMACGLPVLASITAGSTHDLVQESLNGYRFDPHDIDQMANVMTKVSALSDAQRQTMGEHSMRMIQDWGPERFGQGLWAAVSIAPHHNGRG